LTFNLFIVNSFEVRIDLTFQRQPMGKNAAYYYDQLIELYNLVCLRLKRESHTWGPSLVRRYY
jgi:hypothetical protein